MNTRADVDKILRSIRPVGWYQILQVSYVVLSSLQVAFNELNILFVGFVPPHQCHELVDPLDKYGINVDNGTNLTVHYRECDILLEPRNATNNGTLHSFTVGCLEGNSFDLRNIGETTVSEWNLVCDDRGISELGQTVTVIGQLIGSTFFTSLSDRYGRKTIFVLTHTAMFAFSVGTTFLPNVIAYISFRFILGAFTQGMGLSATVLQTELFPAEYRGTINAVGGLAWTVCVMVLVAMGYFMRHLSWRYFQFVTAMVSCHCIFGYWILDESLRWLVVNNKEKTAMKLLKRATKINKTELTTALETLKPESLELQTHESKEEDVIQDSDCGNVISEGSDMVTKNIAEKKTKKDTFLMVFKDLRLARNTIILWFIWVVNSMTYYGLFMISSTLAGDYYLNIFLSAVVELPALGIYYLIVNRISRKKTGILFHTIAGLSLIISVILASTAKSYSNVNILVTVFSLIGKMAVTASWGLVYLYTVELFPTNLRNIGLGTCSAAARIGGMVAPFSRLLADVVVWGPGLLFGVSCLSVTLLLTFLPETKDRTLPQTLDEFKAWSSSKFDQNEGLNRASTGILLSKIKTESKMEGTE